MFTGCFNWSNCRIVYCLRESRTFCMFCYLICKQSVICWLLLEFFINVLVHLKMTAFIVVPWAFQMHLVSIVLQFFQSNSVRSFKPTLMLYWFCLFRQFLLGTWYTGLVMQGLLVQAPPMPSCDLWALKQGSQSLIASTIYTLVVL